MWDWSIQDNSCNISSLFKEVQIREGFQKIIIPLPSSPQLNNIIFIEKFKQNNTKFKESARNL